MSIILIQHSMQREAFAGFPYLLRPGFILSHANKIFPHDLIEHCISYFFGIVQSSVTLDVLNVCSSWSTSLWVTMLGFPKQHF